MIAVDAMGGDLAPDVVLNGALRCARAKKIKICLFGPKEELEKKLEKIDPLWKSYESENGSCLVVVDAPDIIEMGEEPVQAVRKKRKSSLMQAIESVVSGRCKAIVSAGNSGAVMAASLFFIGRTGNFVSSDDFVSYKCIDRPALVGLLPAAKRPVVCLDLGANADCKAEHLYQFAHLGAKYATDMLGIKKPSVGLLSNGEEPAKGSLITKQAFGLLKKSVLNFSGNVEPCHILQNKVDVVVCDGFSGNILLKTLEAAASFCRSVMEDKIGEKLSDKGFYKSVKLIKEELCFDKQGGALLLGIKKPVIVVHGNASARTIERAISFANEIVLKIDVESYYIGDRPMTTKDSKTTANK